MFAAHFVDAACRRGEKCACFAFEAPEQIVRNMRSVGLDLQKHLDADLLLSIQRSPISKVSPPPAISSTS